MIMTEEEMDEQLEYYQRLHEEEKKEITKMFQTVIATGKDGNELYIVSSKESEYKFIIFPAHDCVGYEVVLSKEQMLKVLSRVRRQINEDNR